MLAPCEGDDVICHEVIFFKCSELQLKETAEAGISGHVGGCCWLSGRESAGFYHSRVNPRLCSEEVQIYPPRRAKKLSKQWNIFPSAGVDPCTQPMPSHPDPNRDESGAPPPDYLIRAARLFPSL